MRKFLDMAKTAYKKGDQDTARELYNGVLEDDPANKEAQFYLQKMKVKTTTVKASVRDARNISFIDSASPRLDQLLGGGVKMGDTVLVEGPPFCGKEVLLEQLLASSLGKGVPVIYVSTNRAMKEVMRSIIKRVPDFKEYNHQGMIRMYDLFSKFKDDKVLREGHRIFNIEDREDFQRFQGDLVFAIEDLVKTYHGGMMIINSLSPLISQVDHNDLMKFLQVLIARSKSYRFTNILDMAAGVHSESVINSVEYLMDGIMEFREQEMKNMCRMKGFSQNIMTRDWVEYVLKDNSIHIVGSFMEERIV
jgi:KaiC/GvpD/RAD55 family RecA-like ATPase